MNEIVSIIVPIYAVEKWLSVCVKSLVNQTYLELEIILVNDGSPDHCAEICDAWSKRDERIRVVHKQNGGLASARNAGMDVMTGELFMFVDSDDFLDRNTVQCMVDGINSSGADIVCCGMRKVFPDTDRIEPDQYVPGTYEQKEAVRHLLLWDGEVRSYSCGKLFRTEAVGDIRFIEKLKYGEDTPFVYEALSRSKQICQLPEIKYNYLQREDSLIGSVYSSKKLLTVKAAQIVSEQCKQDFPELNDYADYHVAMGCYIVLGELVMSRAEKKYPDDCRFLRDTMKKYPARMIAQKSSWKRGIFYGLVCRAPEMYRIKAIMRKLH